MRVPIDDILGVKFNLLTIISDMGMINGKRNVECKCDCGNIKTIRLDAVKSGASKGCGCINLLSKPNNQKTHGLSKSGGTYNVWKGIVQRCINKNNPAYNNYGGRGIYVCDEWLHSFEVFNSWCLQNGWKKGLQIDRKDNNGPYAPYNCRFTKVVENVRNRRSTVMGVYNGVEKPLAEWAEIYGLKYPTFYSRVKRKGWSIHDAITIKKYGR